MPKPLAPPPPGPVGDFASYLRGLLIHAGKPDYSQMRRATSYGRSALSAAFAGKQLPTWELAARLVRFLGGDVDDARQRWATAQTPRTKPGFGEELAAGLTASQPAPAALGYITRPEAHGLLLIPRQLPMDVPHFTGRASEVIQLDAVLAQTVEGMLATVVISAIDGTAGVGKTALAVHWAHRVQGRFPDGQLYINLRGYDPGPAVSPEEALGRFLLALNVPPARIPTGLEEQAALYRSLLVGRRMLIVLDNAATPHQVRPLLPGSPGCQVVVTSRSSLAGLVVREGARRLTLDTLAPDEALTLLRQIIGTTRIDAEPDAATELARLCAFLPLALRIAGARAASFPHTTLADVVCELADEHHRLDMLAIEDETTTVCAVFSWSYRRLDPDHAHAFRLLGLHTGPDISTPAVTALLSVPPARARQLLDALSNAHLLVPVSHNRYRFHDLLRLYAANRAHADETDQDRHTAIRRLLSWFLHTADAADRQLMPYRKRVPLDLPEPGTQHVPLSTRSQALKWCDSERANLVAATRHAHLGGHHTTAWQLPVVLWGFFSLRKHWPEWITTHDIGLAAATDIRDRFGQAYILTTLANAYRDLRRFEEALDHFHQALAIWDEIGSPARWEKAAALTLQGMAYLDLRRYDDTLTSLQQALAIFRQVGDPWGEGWALHLLSESNRRLARRYEEAIDHAHHALDAFGQIDDRWGLGWSLHDLGQNYRCLRRFEEAIDHFQRALTARREIGDRQGEAVTLKALGATLYDADKKDLARNSWRCALAIFNDLNDPLAVEVRTRLEELDPPQNQ
ncbi:MAG: ATP-binding protein [Pseudonocardiaceae bacterium]